MRERTESLVEALDGGDAQIPGDQDGCSGGRERDAARSGLRRSLTACVLVGVEAASAVGFAWLGAAAARLASLRLDRPRTDAAFWLYLSAELALGTAAVIGARKGARA